MVVAALDQPELDPLQLTRLLTAERTGVAVELVLTKADLLSEAEQRRWRERLMAEVTPLSSSPPSAAMAWPSCVSAGGTWDFGACGPSGVGKSSLINALLPQLSLRVSAVSGRLQRGATRHVELFPLASGALLADSPGFNRPSLPADPAELGMLFPEIRQRLEAAFVSSRIACTRAIPAAPWVAIGIAMACISRAWSQSSSRRGNPGCARPV